MEIRIEASELPGSSCGPSRDVPDGYRNVHVGVQRRSRRDELLGLTRGDAPTARWDLECSVVSSPTGIDIRGPYIQGPPGARFIYLSWGTVDDRGTFTLFRRAKLWLDGVPGEVIDDAFELGALVGSLGLTDGKGHPLCAAVRPPLIAWSAAAPA